MSLGLPQYRITADDLPDADRKLLRGIEPLLDALNLSLNAAISSLNNLAIPALKEVGFTTAANGAAYVVLGLGAPATDVWVTGLVPSDGSTLDSVYSMSWTAQTGGARLLFVGLAPLTTYALRIRYL